MGLYQDHIKLKKPKFSKEGRLKIAEKKIKKMLDSFPEFLKQLYKPSEKPWRQGGGNGFGNGPRIPSGYGATP